MTEMREGSEADRRLTRHIDVLLGAQLKALRLAARMRQEDAGAALGVSKGQWQKYENGSNRMPAARLWQFCRLMGIDIAAIYEDLPWNVPGAAPRPGMAESDAAFDHEPGVAEAQAMAEEARSLSPAGRRLALAAIRGMRAAETKGLSKRTKIAPPE